MSGPLRGDFLTYTVDIHAGIQSAIEHTSWPILYTLVPMRRTVIRTLVRFADISRIVNLLYWDSRRLRCSSNGNVICNDVQERIERRRY